jgi:indole-3-glycerol phosphate synthase
MTKTILDKIVQEKRAEVMRLKREAPLADLKERIRRRTKYNDFAAALAGTGTVKLIAEVKKASPSKGVLVEDFKPVELARVYEENGAAAISVLTEDNYFRGNITYLQAIKNEVDIPLLRKDFIFDEYQVYEAAAFGADAILLIAAILEQERMTALSELAGNFNLKCLVEVHNEEEMMQVLLAGAEIIGINNRDLATFKTDLNTTRRLRMMAPEDTIVISESGIGTKADMKKMKEMKVNAVLIGEALVTAKDIPTKIKELLG